MSSPSSNTPVKEFRVGGGIKVAIWRKDVRQGDRALALYSVKIQRSYKDKTSRKWQATDYYRPQDLPRLILAAQKAFEFVSLAQPAQSDSQTGSAR